MMRVNTLRRFAALPAMSKRALSTTDSLLGKYGIVPAASTNVFRNLSYDDIFKQGMYYISPLIDRPLSLVADFYVYRGR